MPTKNPPIRRGFEIIEQISKILFGIAVISLFASGNTSQDAALAALAVSFGGVLSFIMLFACCGKIKKTGPDYTRELLQNALPPTLSRFATTLLHLGTTTILPLGLMAWGLSKEAALSQYGILTSMAYPVVYMPLTVIGALCVVLLPEVAKNLGDYVRLKAKIFPRDVLCPKHFPAVFPALIAFCPGCGKNYLPSAAGGHLYGDADSQRSVLRAQSGIRHYAERSGAPEAPDDQ